MRNYNGKDHTCGIWLMVNHDGQRTLFRLVEVGSGRDVLRTAGELHAPTVVVDVALRGLPALDETPGERRSANSRLIILNMRTGIGDGADGAIVSGSSKAPSGQAPHTAGPVPRLTDDVAES